MEEKIVKANCIEFGHGWNDGIIYKDEICQSIRSSYRTIILISYENNKNKKCD